MNDRIHPIIDISRWKRYEYLLVSDIGLNAVLGNIPLKQGDSEGTDTEQH